MNDVEQQNETWRRHLADLEWKMPGMFSLIHRAADDFRTELEKFAGSVAWYKIDAAAPGYAEIPKEQRERLIKIEHSQRRLRERFENAISQVAREFERERLKYSKKLSKVLQFIHILSPSVAGTLFYSVNSETDGFALDMSRYAAAVGKAATRCKIEIGSAVGKYLREIPRTPQYDEAQRGPGLPIMENAISSLQKLREAMTKEVVPPGDSA
jgi:hypothetical protein